MRLLLVPIALVIVCDAYFFEMEKKTFVCMYVLNSAPLPLIAHKFCDKRQNNVFLNNGDIKRMYEDLKMSPGYKNGSLQYNYLYNEDAFIISMRSRDEFHRVAHSKELCKPQTALYDGAIRSVYFEHELNVPYEVPCLSCHNWIDQYGFLSDFYIATSATVDNRDLVDQNRWKLMYTVHRNNLVNYDKKGRGILQRARPTDYDMEDEDKPTPELTAFNDGRLLVTPTEGTSENWNSITTKCSIYLDEELPERLDTAITATYLTDDSSSDARYRIEHFELEDQEKKVVGKEKPEMNLKYFLSWRDWGCCSSCCCTAEECGEEFAVSEEECAKMTSFRKRLGYMSIAKINPLKPIANISLDTAKYLEYLLSSQPYVQFGVPLHTSVISKAMREEIRSALKITPKPSSLGMYFEIENCNDLSQKKICTELDLCRKGEEQRLFNYDSTIQEDQIGKEEVIDDQSCRTLPFEEFTVDHLEVTFPLKLGLNYRIVVNEGRFGKLTKVDWQIEISGTPGKTVAAYDRAKHCKQQKLVVAPNEKDLIIVNVGEKIDGTTIKGRLTPFDIKTSHRDVTVKFEYASKPVMESKSKQIIKWLLICAGLLVVLGVVIFTINSMSVRQMNAKLAKRKMLMRAAPDAKEVKKGSLPNEASRPKKTVMKDSVKDKAE